MIMDGDVTQEELAGMLKELRELMAMAERNHQHLEDKGDRIELREAEIAQRINGLEAAQRDHIAVQQARIEEMREAMQLMLDSTELILSTAERYGFDRKNRELPLVDWLAAVLPNAAAGWPSVN